MSGSVVAQCSGLWEEQRVSGLWEEQRVREGREGELCERKKVYNVILAWDSNLVILFLYSLALFSL